MKSTILRASLLATGALVLAGPANADVLFDQAYDGSGFAASSQNDTGGGNGNFATVYDDFSVAADSNITGLTFTGIFFNPPEVGDITGFTVNVYDDAANQPGSVLSSTFFGGNGGQACADVTCTYSLGLTFSASAATTYWLSIVPDLSFPPQWGWAESLDGNNLSYQDFFGVRAPLLNDEAFTLTGSAIGGGVPEPSAWTLLILGFGAIGGALRGRKGRLALA